MFSLDRFKSKSESVSDSVLILLVLIIPNGIAITY